jgi:hypothetical protein
MAPRPFSFRLGHNLNGRCVSARPSCSHPRAYFRRSAVRHIGESNDESAALAKLERGPRGAYWLAAEGRPPALDCQDELLSVSLIPIQLLMTRTNELTGALDRGMSNALTPAPLSSAHAQSDPETKVLDACLLHRFGAGGGFPSTSLSFALTARRLATEPSP